MNTREWKKVGKLHKRNAFSGDGIDALHRAIRKLLPRVRDIADVAVSPATNEYLRGKIASYVSKEFPYLRGKQAETTIGFYMLQYSPCTLEGAEDFCLYVRVRKGKGRKKV